MGQILSKETDGYRCNLAAIQTGGSQADHVLDNGEIWFVNTSNERSGGSQEGFGYYDSYIKGDGSTKASLLTVHNVEDKRYAPEVYSGLGKRILPKNMVVIGVPFNGFVEGVAVETAGTTSEPSAIFFDTVNKWFVGQIGLKYYNAWQGNGDYEPVSETKTYVYNGKGYTWDDSEETLVEGDAMKNVLTQGMVSQANTLYIVQYDYDLNGQTITLPANVTLQFEGGSLANGIIICQKTDIVLCGYIDALYSVDLQGVWSVNTECLCIDAMRTYDQSLSPTNMRLFLQGAIDYASRLGVNVKFPYQETFTIDIPPMSVDSWEYTTAYTEKQGGYGLVIPSNIEIDFNYSKLQVEPNSFWVYSIIYFNQDCINTSIKNGIFIGDRQNHTMSGVRSTDEWIHGVNIKGRKIKVTNCDISELRGDGIVSGGFNQLNTTKALNGNDFSEIASYDNYNKVFNAESNLLTISSYYWNAWSSNVNIARLSFIIPYSDHAGTNDAVGCHYLVDYYDGSETHLGREYLLRGEYCHIPQGAVYMKLSIFCDDVATFIADATAKFWVCNLFPTEEIYVDNCHIHDCGRNGISLSAANKHYYRNLNIEKISGTNNYIGIDFEGYGGDTTYNIHIEKCRIITGNYTQGGDIAIINGRSIFVDNCNCYNIYGRGFDVHISNCLCERITLSITTNSGQTSSGNMELLSRSVVSNTTTDLLYICSGVAENSSANKIAETDSNLKNIVIASPPIYRNCKINFVYLAQPQQSFMCAKYINCEITSTKQTKTYIGAYYDTSAVFDGCNIEVRNLINNQGFVELRNTKFVHVCGNGISNVVFKTIKNCHIILTGNTVYQAFRISPAEKYALFADNVVEEETSSTIKTALLSLYATEAKVSNVMVRNNHFVSHTSNTSVIGRTGENLNGSTILFSENVVDCTDNIKDFASDLPSICTIHRFNNVYLSNSKLADSNIVDVDSPSA